MAEMKLLYVRESEQPVASGRAVLAAIEFSDREEVRAIVDRIVDAEDKTGISFQSYSYYPACRYCSKGLAVDSFRVLELIVSVPDEATLISTGITIEGMLA